MSEKKLFDEAMRTLRVYNASLTVSEAERSSREAAIRVLEAAGRVDRSKALDGMEAMRAMMSRELFMNTGLTFQAIYTLLESLPDKEEKK